MLPHGRLSVPSGSAPADVLLVGIDELLLRVLEEIVEHFFSWPVRLEDVLRQ